MELNHLEKLKAFLEVLIDFKGVTAKKLEELKDDESVELSNDQDFTIIGKLAAVVDNERCYAITFKDKADENRNIIEVGIVLSTKKYGIKKIFTCFALQMLRYKYGRSGVLVIRDVKKELGVSSLSVDTINESIKNFTDCANGKMYS